MYLMQTWNVEVPYTPISGCPTPPIILIYLVSIVILSINPINTSGAGTAYLSGAPEFTPGFCGVRITRSLVLYVCFVDRCLSFCVFFFWPLCCLFFYDIRILITALVSSNSSVCYFEYFVVSCLPYLVFKFRFSNLQGRAWVHRYLI